MNAELLRSVPFLKNLSEDELQKFSALLKVHDVAAKERIIEEGKPVNEFHIVFHGTVHARHETPEREVLLGRIGPGGFFGEMNLFDPGLGTASIYAMDKVTLASVGHEELREFMSTHPAIGYQIVTALMTGLSRRLRQTNERFVNTLYWAGAAAPADHS